MTSGAKPKAALTSDSPHTLSRQSVPSALARCPIEQSHHDTWFSVFFRIA
jgi:hypothetical protein